MDLSRSIRQVPRPFDADKGWDIAKKVPDLTPDLAALVAGTAGCSPYLAVLLEKEAQWLSASVWDLDAAIEAEIESVHHLSRDALADGLRQVKRRIALLVALADLAAAWPLEKVTQTLSNFADAACQAALRTAVSRQIQRGKLPGMQPQDAQDAAGMAVLAMGKMGAGELNYSSDIDLICLFDETRFDSSDYHEVRAAFSRATREMTATLSEITSQGYVFRTDLRLRPDPSVTPVCIAMEAAERYYESLGRTWERAAYIKARVAAGDLKAGANFLATLKPFIWRRHLDFAAIQDAHDMRLAIREHKGFGGPITLPGHNMKLGRGGIREIEFFTQTRQLIAGGRDADLRCRGTVPGLRVLAQKGWVETDVAETLETHYIAHRTVEHRLQMVQDAQTHSLPRQDEGFARLAAMMDTTVAELQTDIKARLVTVHELTEGFFSPQKTAEKPSDAQLDPGILNRWVSYPALRSSRSRQIFERVRPELLRRLGEAARPQEALVAFDGFLAGLPAGVQLFSLLEANPQLTDLIVDITGTSPALAQYLSRNAGVFDAVIGGDFFIVWPGQRRLTQGLDLVLSVEDDYERQLDAARRWYKEWHFRIGVHLLRGLITAQEANAQYTDLARAVLCGLWPRVIEMFSQKYGTPPGRGAIVMGMGSLGAGTLTTGSDLDLIVVYDPLEEDVSNGRKPIATRLYYARLTQALITALSAPMAQGKLFEVDMRLRPSGNQGPVATSWPAFKSYQQDQAWLWEHLALIRAEVVTGPQDLATDMEQFLNGLLKAPRKKDEVAREVARMQSRIRDAKTSASLWDVKIGAGRLQEIELMAQAGALLSGNPGADTLAGLKGAVIVKLLTEQEADRLASAATLFGTLNTALRLLSDTPLPETAFGLAAQNFLRRATGADSMQALEATLQESYTQCDTILSCALAPYSGLEEAR